MSDEAFEKAWQARGGLYFDYPKEGARWGWGVALAQGRAEMQEPQTSETCQANPPHPKAYIYPVEPHLSTRRCLLCSEKAKARREALLEAGKIASAHNCRLYGTTRHRHPEACICSNNIAAGIHRLLDKEAGR